METNVRYTMAGIFVLILVLFIALGIIWLSAGFSTAEYKYYRIYMNEAISGLSVDGPVEFNGVEVGTVYQTKINPNDPRLVEILIRVRNDTPITVATRAKLGVRALTGMAYILLQDKGNDRQPLLAQGDEEYPIIKTVPSILVRLDTTLTQMNNSFKEVTASLKNLLTPENLRSIKGILEASKTTMQKIDTTTIPATNNAIANIDVMTQDLRDAAASVRENPAVLFRGRQESSVLGPGER